ncbi:S-layer homology domain-containing protein [Paenibacillus sacheonensis]|uniref:SLH domain-containing protein n=1 Tax=Paenibacillus sacheonensis TaxID=742054 RepID=A0A7X5C3X3_9BACL|nr:S-layer homology domain-containing protein [Paenibacillus sacheonensis]MBM7569055.1 hypothetical protein [Paenibacillus sacheonensis]NBC72765.1 hypothetical protein [Paenibacillus sacheonensis]
MKKPFKMIALSTTAAALMFGFAGPQITSAASLKDYGQVQGNSHMAAMLQSNLIAGNNASQVDLLLDSLGLNLNSLLHSSWYAQYSHNSVSWYENVIAGFNNPHRQLTREQFTYRLISNMEARGKLPLIKPVVVKFTDFDRVSPAYAASIQRALSYNIVQLDANGKFNPKSIISNAEAKSEIQNAQNYLKAHSSPVDTGKKLTGVQAVQLIKQVVGPDAALQIKIDPTAAVTRESFTYLLVHTLQSSGQLPMINVVPVNIKDESAMDVSKSGAIQTALALGFLSLDQAGNFQPNAKLTLSEAAAISAKATSYLKSHPASPVGGATITAEQAIQLIKQAAGSNLQIKINPNTVMNRQSFTYLLVHTLQTSGKLPKFNLIPAEIKDDFKIDILSEGAIQTALALKIVQLDPTGLFNPDGEITLKDATAMVNRAIEVVKMYATPKALS